VKRENLITKLREQLASFESKRTGQPFAPTTIKTLIDKQTGERMVAEVPKRVREWFWRTDAGKWNLQLRYGTKTLTLAKGGKNAIEIDSAEVFAKTVDALIVAVSAGELDNAMAELSAQTRRGFGK
jgi:protoporphyrinogen oxidase